MKLATLLVATAALMTPAAALGGDGPPDKAAPTGDTADAPAHPMLDAAKPVDGHSLYQLKTPLVDQNARALSLDAYRGQPVIVSLFYATCPAACPLLIHDLQRLEQALTDEQRAQLRILLISIDPERDIPEVLKAAAVRYGVDETRWSLTRADEARVREVAAVLGIKYRKAPDGTIGHTSLLTLLDREGIPIARIEGLGQPVEPFVQALQGLSKPRPAHPPDAAPQ